MTRTTRTSSSIFTREHMLQRKPITFYREQTTGGNYLEEGDASGLYEERSSFARALAHAQ